LQSSEPFQWTKYTIDGTEPSDANGANCIPGEPIVIDKTTTLKFRSKDLAGNIEPVKAAAFTIERPVTDLVFDNDPDRDGSSRPDASGRGVQVGSRTRSSGALRTLAYGRPAPRGVGRRAPAGSRRYPGTLGGFPEDPPDQVKGPARSVPGR